MKHILHLLLYTFTIGYVYYPHSACIVYYENINNNITTDVTTFIVIHISITTQKTKKLLFCQTTTDKK